MRQDTYDANLVSTIIKALENADQYHADILHQRGVLGEANLFSSIGTIAKDDFFWGYVEIPAGLNNGVVALHPAVRSTQPVTLRGYFNPTIDETGWTPASVPNLRSDGTGGFKGNMYTGNDTDNAASISSKGSLFYEALIGTGKKDGATVSSNIVGVVSPGDSLLMEIENTSTSDADVSINLPLTELTEENNI
jgi:hypothetical protein